MACVGGVWAGRMGLGWSGVGRQVWVVCGLGWGAGPLELWVVCGAAGVEWGLKAGVGGAGANRCRWCSPAHWQLCGKVSGQQGKSTHI